MIGWSQSLLGLEMGHRPSFTREEEADTANTSELEHSGNNTQVAHKYLCISSRQSSHCSYHCAASSNRTAPSNDTQQQQRLLACLDRARWRHTSRNRTVITRGTQAGKEERREIVRHMYTYESVPKPDVTMRIHHCELSACNSSEIENFMTCFLATRPSSFTFARRHLLLFTCLPPFSAADSFQISNIV